MNIAITIDDRERPSGVEKILRQYNEVTVSIKRLTLGDYLLNKKILFERKTLPDFAASIIDGRLFKQVARLAQSSYKCVLILEGTKKDADDLRIKREAMQGALITVSLIFGIPILRAQNAEETGRLIIYTAKQINFIANGAGIRKGRRPKKKDKLQLHILQGLPDVGVKRAQQLLAAFGNVENVMQASYEKLITVAGIGNDTAKKIRWAVKEDQAKYQAETNLS